MSKKNLKRTENSCQTCKFAKWNKEKTQYATKKVLIGHCTYPIQIDYNKLPACAKISVQVIREDCIFVQCPMYQPQTK